MEQYIKPLISVIIPVYNDEPFLHRCVDSVLNQTYQFLEILLIDDGSSDNSGRICDEYQAKDKRVRSVHKPNGGTVSARKCGLAHAQGQLVSFIDGDDWIENNMYENLAECYLNEGCPDVISFGMICEYPESGIKNPMLDGIREGRYDKENIERILPVLIYDSDKSYASLLTSVCTKLVKKAVAQKAMEYMSESLTMGEDGANVYFMVACCTSLSVIHKTFYHYEQHVNSQNYKFDAAIFSKLANLKQIMTAGLDRLGWNGNQIQAQINYYIWDYLCNAVEKNVHLDINRRICLFPFARCEKASTIIVYGAGKVGKSYIKCLKQSNFAKNFIWVDKNYQKLQDDGLKVTSLETALQETYDYIVIAIENEAVANSIATEILTNGADSKKIIWEKPIWTNPYDWDNV